MRQSLELNNNSKVLTVTQMFILVIISRQWGIVWGGSDWVSIAAICPLGSVAREQGTRFKGNELPRSGRVSTVNIQ